MQYHSTIPLKDGRVCILRSATAGDAEEVLRVFRRTHEETDYLLSYPDEIRFAVEEERAYLDSLATDERAVEIAAVLDGMIVGTAGISPVGSAEKQRRRASFGVGVLKSAWRLGVGRALTRACIDCAKRAGYAQLELEVVEENAHAIELYRSEGFVEYGRNPRGFCSRFSGWQTLVLMRLELS